MAIEAAVVVAEKDAVKNLDSTSAFMQIIERCAANPAVDVDKMQKILDMQEQILNRNAKQAFSVALAHMQPQLPSIQKNGAIKKTDKTIQSKYALFDDINEQIKPILEQYGFSLTFRIFQTKEFIRVTAVLLHEKGHSEETAIELPSDMTGSKNAVQAIASSVSYGKRHTACAILNITTHDEDDDGNNAGSTAKDFVSPEQQSTIAKLVVKLMPEHKSAFHQAYPKISEIKKVEFDLVLAKLNRSLNAIPKQN